MLSTFGLFGAVFSRWLFSGIRLNNCFCTGYWFHFIKRKIINHVYKLFMPSSWTHQTKNVAVAVFYISLLNKTHCTVSIFFFPQCGLCEQQNMIECALGQEWVALFQPKWGYLYNMSSDEAGTAARGIPYPELPFQGRKCTLVPFTLYPEPPKFTVQQHFPDSKSRPDLYQVVNYFKSTEELTLSNAVFMI